MSIGESSAASSENIGAKWFDAITPDLDIITEIQEQLRQQIDSLAPLLDNQDDSLKPEEINEAIQLLETLKGELKTVSDLKDLFYDEKGEELPFETPPAESIRILKDYIVAKKQKEIDEKIASLEETKRMYANILGPEVDIAETSEAPFFEKDKVVAKPPIDETQRADTFEQIVDIAEMHPDTHPTQMGRIVRAAVVEGAIR